VQKAQDRRYDVLQSNQDRGGALNRCFDFGSPNGPNAYLAELGPDNSMAYTQLQLQRWTGSSWELFGGVLSADQTDQGHTRAEAPKVRLSRKSPR